MHLRFHLFKKKRQKDVFKGCEGLLEMHTRSLGFFACLPMPVLLCGYLWHVNASKIMLVDTFINFLHFSLSLDGFKNHFKHITVNFQQEQVPALKQLIILMFEMPNNPNLHNLNCQEYETKSISRFSIAALSKEEVITQENKKSIDLQLNTFPEQFSLPSCL